MEQLHPRYAYEEDDDPGETTSCAIENSNVDSPNSDLSGPLQHLMKLHTSDAPIIGSAIGIGPITA